MRNIQSYPYTIKDNEGQRLGALGTSISVKATSAQTGGAFNLFEASFPPGYATPLHIHYAEDVAVYVLEGALAFFWGSEQRVAAAGSFFFQPRGIPHGFRVTGGVPARILYLSVPAGFDRFVIEQSLPALRLEPEVAAARYHIEVLGPLPG